MVVKKCADVCEDYFYGIFRVLVGVLFFLHGAQKFGVIGSGSIPGFAEAVGIALWLGYTVAIIELVGGLFIALGLFTRISAAASGIMIITAFFVAHAPRGVNPLANGGELALLYFTAFLLLFAYGSKKWSLEKAIFKKELF